jgi:hypothetical protein
MKPPLKVPVVKAEPPVCLAETKGIRKTNGIPTGIGIGVDSTVEPDR